MFTLNVQQEENFLRMWGKLWAFLFVCFSKKSFNVFAEFTPVTWWCSAETMLWAQLNSAPDWRLNVLLECQETGSVEDLSPRNKNWNSPYFKSWCHNCYHSYGIKKSWFHPFIRIIILGRCPTLTTHSMEIHLVVFAQSDRQTTGRSESQSNKKQNYISLIKK